MAKKWLNPVVMVSCLLSGTLHSQMGFSARLVCDDELNGACDVSETSLPTDVEQLPWLPQVDVPCPCPESASADLVAPQPCMTEALTVSTEITSETLAEVVIENGTIGILKIKAIIDVSRSKDHSSLILILDDPDYDRLVLLNSNASNVTVVIDEPQITFSLVKSKLRQRGIKGKIRFKQEPILILPQRFAEDAVRYQI